MYLFSFLDSTSNLNISVLGVPSLLPLLSNQDSSRIIIRLFSNFRYQLADYLFFKKKRIFGGGYCDEAFLLWTHFQFSSTVSSNVLILYWSPTVLSLIKMFQLKPVFTDHCFYLTSTAGVWAMGSLMQSTMCFFCCTWEPQDNDSLVRFRTCQCAEGNYGPQGSMQVAFEV